MTRPLFFILFSAVIFVAFSASGASAVEKPRIEPQIPEDFEKTSIQYRCARLRPTEIVVILYFDEKEKWIIVVVQRRGKESLLTVSYPKAGTIYYFFRILGKWKPMSQVTKEELKKLREEGLGLESEDAGFADKCAKDADIDGLL